jgi:hypothetical protein
VYRTCNVPLECCNTFMPHNRIKFSILNINIYRIFAF